MEDTFVDVILLHIIKLEGDGEDGRESLSGEDVR